MDVVYDHLFRFANVDEAKSYLQDYYYEDSGWDTSIVIADVKVFIGNYLTQGYYVIVSLNEPVTVWNGFPDNALRLVSDREQVLFTANDIDSTILSYCSVEPIPFGSISSYEEETRTEE